MHKIKLFFSCDFATKILYIEALLFLALARILKSIPFAKISPLLGKQRYETSYDVIECNFKILKEISSGISIVSKYTFWESKCLVQAIAGMKMLTRRRIDCTLYLGIAKDEHKNLIAHAWLRSGPYIITGSEGMEKFTVVNYFAKKFDSDFQ